MADLRFYGNITRVDELDDGNLMIEGVASTESEVKGTILTREAMRAAIPKYMERGAIREMHDLKAAGKAITAEVGEDGLTRISAKVVDEQAKAKVREKVYSAFSVSGKVLERDPNDTRRATKFRWVETSLVDVPGDDAVGTILVRIDDGEDTMSKKKTEKAPEIKAEPAAAPVVLSEAVSRAADPAVAPEKVADKAIEAPVAANTVTRASVMDVIKRGEIADCQQALACISAIEWLMMNEQGEGHPEAASQVSDLKAAIDSLKAFVSSELKETKTVGVEIALAADAGDVQRAGAKFSAETKRVMKEHSDKLDECHRSLKEVHRAFGKMGWNDDDKDEGKDEKDDAKDKDKDDVEKAAPAGDVQRVESPEILQRVADAEAATAKAGEALARVMGERDHLLEQLKGLEQKGVTRIISISKDEDSGRAPKVEPKEEPLPTDHIQRVSELERRARDSVKRALERPSFKVL